MHSFIKSLKIGLKRFEDMWRLLAPTVLLYRYPAAIMYLSNLVPGSLECIPSVTHSLPRSLNHSFGYSRIHPLTQITRLVIPRTVSCLGCSLSQPATHKSTTQIHRSSPSSLHHFFTCSTTHSNLSLGSFAQTSIHFNLHQHAAPWPLLVTKPFQEPELDKTFHIHAQAATIEVPNLS